MSVQFFALDTAENIIDTEHELSVTGGNALAIMRTLGQDADPKRYPAGEMSLNEMLDAINKAKPTAVHGMVRYLAHLEGLVHEARDAGAHVIAWA